MAMPDRTDLKKFHNLFPEMSAKQSDYSILYSWGISQHLIAEFYDVTEESVQKSLKLAQQKLMVFNLNMLRAVVLIRLNIYALLNRRD